MTYSVNISGYSSNGEDISPEALEAVRECVDRLRSIGEISHAGFTGSMGHVDLLAAPIMESGGGSEPPPPGGNK